MLWTKVKINKQIINLLYKNRYSQWSRKINENCICWHWHFHYLNNESGLQRRIPHLTKTIYSYPEKNNQVIQHIIGNENNTPMIKKGKVHVERESIFHHKVLEDSDAYNGTLFKSDPTFSDRYKISDAEFKTIIEEKDWESKSPYNVATSFISLGVYSASSIEVTVDDERFDKLSTAFVNQCSSFTDDQLIDCLIAFQLWPLSDHVKAQNFLKLWKALDKVCLQRHLDWSVDKILYMMDLWYQIRLIRLSNFVYKGLPKISRKCDTFSSAQMVQALFYMSCLRKIHGSICLREYEYLMQKHITHLTIEEIAIFHLAYFKTKKAILNQKLLIYTMQRVVEEAEQIPDITLTAITKSLRLSHKPAIGFTANDMVKHLVERKMDSTNLINCIHILHISTQIQFYNEEAITKLAEVFCRNPSVARLKDLERVTFILSLFNFIPPTTPDIVDVIVQQLDEPQHAEAGAKYHLTMLSLVYFLTLLRAFPEKHIRYLLDEKMLNINYSSKYMMDVQIVKTDFNRVLEGPPGSEHLLSPTLREYIARRHSMFIPDQKYAEIRNQFDIMMTEVIQLTNELLGGPEYSLVTWTLPHYPRADILFHLDENGKPLPIPEDFRVKASFENVLRPPDGRWNCVVIGGRNMYMHNVPKLVGEQLAKLRQLRILGYTPIMIPAHYWKREPNKLDFLKLKYFSPPG